MSAHQNAFFARFRPLTTQREIWINRFFSMFNTPFNYVEWGINKTTKIFIKKILIKLVLIKETAYLRFPIYFYNAQPDTSQKKLQL